MTEFWEASFTDKQTMWGFEPADSAIAAKDFFLEKQVKDILIPGIGYGRNAKHFLDHGMKVTGIEISQTAINLAETHYGKDLKIYHGPVADMPFDDQLYDGLFCHALIHLLNSKQREKLISDCYAQLKPGGYMIFSAISTKSPTYGTGKKLGQNWYETTPGVHMFFYDHDSVKQEFENYGLIDIKTIDEPVKNRANQVPFKFLLISCKK